jgi:hypothetical protein
MAFMAKAARDAKANANSRQAETGATEPEKAATATGVGGATDLDSAAGVLALAQKLHEEYVAEGEDKRQRLITEGQSRHDQIIGEATARQKELLLASQVKHDALIAEADVLKVEADVLKAEATAEHERMINEARERSAGMVVVAEAKRAEVLHELSNERSVLQKEVEEIRAAERDHLARQKSYLEDQLIELEKTRTDETG